MQGALSINAFLTMVNIFSPTRLTMIANMYHTSVNRVGGQSTSFQTRSKTTDNFKRIHSERKEVRTSIPNTWNLKCEPWRAVLSPTVAYRAGVGSLAIHFRALGDGIAGLFLNLKCIKTPILSPRKSHDSRIV